MKLDDFKDTKRGNTYTGAELSKAVKRLTAARDGKALLTELERRLLQPRMRLFDTRPISPPIAHLIAIGAFTPTSEQLETLRKFDPATFGTPPAEAAQPVDATHEEEEEELTLEAAKRLGAKAFDARVHDLEKRFPGIWRERSRELTRARTHGAASGPSHPPTASLAGRPPSTPTSAEPDAAPPHLAHDSGVYSSPLTRLGGVQSCTRSGR